MDGGLSWSGLNQFLPNLAVKRILSTPVGTAGTRVESESLGVLELPPGGSVWLPATARLENEAARQSSTLQLFSTRTGVKIVSYGQAEGTIYAGTADGLSWVEATPKATVPTHPLLGNAMMEEAKYDEESGQLWHPTSLPSQR